MARVNQKGRLMTEGPIWKHIVLFAFPLLIGNLFQQFYNTVDSIVVGNFVSTQALAAVGSTTAIINTFIGFFMGLSAGSGIVISQAYGARDDKRVHDTVHTMVLASFIVGVGLSILGVLGAPHMLKLMSTPADVMDDAKLYLQIYFSGALTIVMYNMGSGVMRAVGDSKRPLYFLILSASLNVVFDLVFVLVFKMGIAGVAVATVLAQGISAALILISLSRTHENYRLIWKDLHIQPEILKRIVGLGLPSAIQMMITSFSNVFVQGYINGFGSAGMAGWSSYSKIDQFVMLPMQAVSLASTTFVGQNIGGRNIPRAEKGVRTSIGISFSVTLVLSVLLMIFARPMLMMFTSEPAVLDYGELFIRTNTMFLPITCMNQIYAGALRGSGDTKAPMAIMLSSYVVFRQIYLFAASRIAPGNPQVISLGYPLGWVLCTVLMFIYYRKSNWQKRCLERA